MDGSKSRVEIIDGLRGFAILIVMWYHIWQQSWLWPRFNIFGLTVNLDFLPRVGFFGVEIFFVISGFCLFYPYVRNKLLLNEPRKLDWKSFYKRRVFKIIPCYYLMLLAVVPLAEDFPEHVNQLWYFLRHALCLNSLSMETFHSRYNGVLWSLSVEAQFYIVFPALCYIMLRGPIATFLTVCALSNYYRLYILVDNPYRFSFMFNQLPGTLDLFVGGMFAAFAFVWMQKLLAHKSPPRWLPAIATLVSMLAFFALLELFKTEWRFVPVYMPEGAAHIQVWQSNVRWLLMLLCILVIIGGCFAYKAWIMIFSNKILVFLSAISYNLYLWHAFIAISLKYRLKIPAYEIINDQYPNMYGDTGWQISYSILVAALSIAIAAVITYAFERPVAEALRKKFNL